MRYQLHRRRISIALVASLSTYFGTNSIAHLPSDDSLIVSGFPQPLDVATLPGACEQIRVTPFRPETRSIPFETSFTVNTSAATDYLATSKATAVWDPSSAEGPSLHVIPI